MHVDFDPARLMGRSVVKPRILQFTKRAPSFHVNSQIPSGGGTFCDIKGKRRTP